MTTLYAQGLSEEGATLLCEAAGPAPSDPHPMEILADTELVPPSIQPGAAKLLADLHREYPNDGLILYDYTMVKSRRWSGDTNALPDDFVQSLKSALSLNPRMPQAYYQLALAYDLQKLYLEEMRHYNRRYIDGFIHVSGRKSGLSRRSKHSSDKRPFY